MTNNFIFNIFFQITSATYPGAVFLLSAGISCISLILSVYIHISLKGRPIAEVTRLGADRLTEKEREEQRIVEARKFNHENYNNSSISHI